MEQGLIRSGSSLACSRQDLGMEALRRVEGIEAVCRFDAEAEAELAMAAGFCKLQFAVGPTALEGAAQDSSRHSGLSQAVAEQQVLWGAEGT